MHILPQLPYSYDSLEPVIDKQTMEIHHTKHHATYIDKLNKALEGNEVLQNTKIEDLLLTINTLPENIRQAVRNHGGGHHNHTLFWESLRPSTMDNTPSSEVESLLMANFESFDNFKELFTNAALNQFGSGWAWLVKTTEDKLAIYSTPNQDSPLTKGDTPILGLDVWEHAYYLKYQNRRAEYINAWWSVVNWDTVSTRLEA